MRSFSFFAAVLALGATTAFAQSAPAAVTAVPVPLQLEVAVRGYAADDRARSMAGDSAADKIESYVWADRSLCGMGAGSTPPAATPWVGWHFVGTVQGVSQDAGRASVTFRVEWQRMWENGAKVADGSKGVSSTSLREGERLELDRVTGGGEGCSVTQARLEVGAVARPTYRLAVGNMLNTMRTGRAGGRGAAPAPQATTGTATGSKVIAPKVETFNKEDLMKVFQEKTFKRSFHMPGTYDAELWLVHRYPDGKETTELKKVQFTGADLAFTFPAVVVTTAKGDLSLDFSGTLRAGVGPEAATVSSFFRTNLATRGFTTNASATDLTGIAWRPKPQTGVAPSPAAAGADNAVRIAVTIARRARANFTPPLDLRGGSYFFMNVPAPDDVISFEFPSLPQPGTEDLLKGHTFSLRIRVTPVAK